MRASRGVQTVERKVHFYRLIAGTSLPRPVFNPLLAAQLIDGIGFIDGKRYLDVEDGKALCVWPVPTTGNVKLRMGIVRRSGLPDIEEGGNIIPLGIADGQGLVEVMHMVFFPNNIVGAEYNFYGPRISRLPGYLHAKCGNLLPPIQFAILLRQDVQEQLARLQTIRVAQIRIHRSHFDLVRQADENLFQVFRACEAAAEAENVEIIFRPESYSRENLGGRLLNSVRRLIGIPGIREGAETFRIESFNNQSKKIESIDLLGDQFVTSRRVLKLPGRQRGVDPAAMFQFIEEAYGELRDQLEGAAGAET
jgi:hypothetical protein